MPDTPSQERDDLRLGAGALLVLAGAALIAWSTLRPQPGEFGAVAVAAWSPFEALLNVFLFLPLGAGLALAGTRFRGVAGAAMLVSAAVELAQLWLVRGRYASIADVVANTLGAIVGALIVWHWDRRARWWRWLSPATAVTIVLTWVVGGYLAQPAIPPVNDWQVETGPVEVIAAHIQGIPLSQGAVRDVPRLHAQLSASRKTRLTFEYVTDTASEGRTRILALVSGASRGSFLVLEQEGTTLRGYQRTGLRWVGLRTPWLVLRDAIPPGAGDTVLVTLEGTRRHILLTASTGGESRQASLRLSPDLYATALFARATDWLLWWWIVPAAMCFLALGLALAARPRLLAALCLVLMVVIPNRSDCAYPGMIEAVIGALAAFLGMRLGRRIGLVTEVSQAG